MNGYRVCIAKNMGELACTSEIEMKIKLKSNSKPRCVKPYKLNTRDREDLGEIVEDYQSVVIIKNTHLLFASPAFLVRKKDGTAA